MEVRLALLALAGGGVLLRIELECLLVCRTPEKAVSDQGWPSEPFSLFFGGSCGVRLALVGPYREGFFTGIGLECLLRCRRQTEAVSNEGWPVSGPFALREGAVGSVWLFWGALLPFMARTGTFLETAKAATHTALANLASEQPRDRRTSWFASPSSKVFSPNISVPKSQIPGGVPQQQGVLFKGDPYFTTARVLRFQV